VPLDGSTAFNRSPDRGDVQLWIAAYRAGLVLAELTVLALVAPGHDGGGVPG
jgi:hypothetical protein